MDHDDKKLIEKAVTGDATISFPSKKKKVGKAPKQHHEEDDEDIEDDDDDDDEEDDDDDDEAEEGEDMDHEEFISQINEKFQDVTTEMEKLEQEYFKERLALDLKYQNLYEPVFEKRAELISSSSKPVVAAAEENEDEEEGIAQNFWLTVLMCVSPINEYIRASDEDALRYLKDIKVKLLDTIDDLGYQIIFVFDENPFFSNKELIKTLHNRRIFSAGDKGFGAISGTKIEWKSKDKNLCEVKVKKGEEQYVPPHSFFDYFNPETGKALSKINESSGIQISEEEYYAIQRDHEISDAIRGKVVPFAVEYFTGEMVDDEEGEEEEGEEDEEGEEEEEDDDEDDDDDDE